MFGLDMAPKETFSRLFNPFNLKILDLNLETWLWSPLICVVMVATDILFLTLLSSLKLILSSFLSLFFIIAID